MQEIIIKYRRRMIFSEEEFTVFEKIGLVGNRGGIRLSGIEISKKEAMRVIKDNGLVLVHDDKSGQNMGYTRQAVSREIPPTKKRGNPERSPLQTTMQI